MRGRVCVINIIPMSFDKIKQYLVIISDFFLYWAIILLPFSMAISNAAMNSFMGMMIGFFVIKKITLREKVFKLNFLNLAVILLFVMTCLSLLYSIDSKDTFRGGILRLLQYIFVMWIMASQVKDRKHIIIIIIAMAFGLALSSIDSIWQVFTGHDFIRGYPPINNIGLVRATASFADANVLGIYLSALLPLVLGISFFYFKGFKRLSLGLVSLLGLIASALTYSRPTLLGIYVALVFLAIARKKKIILACLILGLLISPFFMPKPVKQFAKDVNYNPIVFMCNEDRIAIYLNSFNMIKAHPVVGVGANVFMKNYKFYKSNPEYKNIVTSDYMYPHNNFIHLTAELGVIGLIIFLWFLWAVFKNIKDIYNKLTDDSLRVILISITASIIAFLVNGLTESSLYYARVAIIFWYLVGFAFIFMNFTEVKIKKGLK